MKYKIEGYEVVGGVPCDDEATLTRELGRELGRMKAQGKIMDYYHRPDRKSGHGERAGLPDFVIAFAPEYVGGLELKKGQEKATEAQVRWIVGFGQLGALARDIGGAVWWVESTRRWIESRKA